MKEVEDYLRLTIEEARCGVEASHGGPFGTVIVHKGTVVARAHNEVIRCSKIIRGEGSDPIPFFHRQSEASCGGSNSEARSPTKPPIRTWSPEHSPPFPTHGAALL